MTYDLHFEYLGDLHGPVGCNNPGPFIDYQTLGAPEGVNVIVNVSGGFATFYSATITAPELFSSKPELSSVTMRCN